MSRTIRYHIIDRGCCDDCDTALEWCRCSVPFLGGSISSSSSVCTLIRGCRNTLVIASRSDKMAGPLLMVFCAAAKSAADNKANIFVMTCWFDNHGEPCSCIVSAAVTNSYMYRTASVAIKLIIWLDIINCIRAASYMDVSLMTGDATVTIKSIRIHS